jgi:hypothetical protein
MGGVELGAVGAGGGGACVGSGAARAIIFLKCRRRDNREARKGRGQFPNPRRFIS